MANVHTGPEKTYIKLVGTSKGHDEVVALRLGVHWHTMTQNGIHLILTEQDYERHIKYWINIGEETIELVDIVQTYVAVVAGFLKKTAIF